MAFPVQVNVANFLAEVDAEAHTEQDGACGSEPGALRRQRGVAGGSLPAMAFVPASHRGPAPGHPDQGIYDEPLGAFDPGEGQADRVRRVTRPLHALFQAFDAGEIELARLRDGLRELGLTETPDTVKLLREREFTFRQLVSALSREDTTALLQRAAGEIPERRRDKEGDIVTHRRGRAPSATLHAPAGERRGGAWRHHGSDTRTHPAEPSL